MQTLKNRLIEGQSGHPGGDADRVFAFEDHLYLSERGFRFYVMNHFHASIWNKCNDMPTSRGKLSRCAAPLYVV